jgi:hypothetical protein
VRALRQVTISLRKSVYQRLNEIQPVTISFTKKIFPAMKLTRGSEQMIVHSPAAVL